MPGSAPRDGFPWLRAAVGAAVSLGLFALVRRSEPGTAAWVVLGCGAIVTVLWSLRGGGERAAEGGQDGFRRFVENIADGYFFYRHDPQRKYHYLSRSVERVLGYTAEEYQRRYASLFTGDPLNAAGAQSTQRTLAGSVQPTFEVELHAKDGTTRRLEITEYPVFDEGHRVRFVEGIAHDVTETRRMQARLLELATRDELTGLFNRRHFQDRLVEAIDLARRHRHSLALAIIDLDGLKRVNDAHGHAAGDAMIRGAAAAIAREVRRSDVVGRLEQIAGRLGGDEFGVILPFSGSEGAVTAVERILSTLARHPVALRDGTGIPLSASAGVAELTPDLDSATIAARADEALYRSKNSGRGRVSIWSPTGN